MRWNEEKVCLKSWTNEKGKSDGKGCKGTCLEICRKVGIEFYKTVYTKFCLASLIFPMLFIVCFPAKAYGAYYQSGETSENAFSLAAAETFFATLSPDIMAGNGSSMKLNWYSKTETGWKKIGAVRTLSDDSSESLKKAELQVEVSFQKNHQVYRYELSNEAGTVLSETFQLSMARNGSAVVCRKESYEADLSDYRPR